MFTGIIETVGKVGEVTDLGGGKRIRIESDLAPDLKVDQSIAVNGVCLTVVEMAANSFEVVAVEETLLKTNIGALSGGSPVNLERTMTMDKRLDGHLVQGHVDAKGRVTNVVEQTTGRLYTIEFEPRFSHYLIPTGSITVDGISLTVARLDDDAFTVAIIPYTFENTTAREWQTGSFVNLEFDMVGKYVIRWLEKSRGAKAPDNISLDLLRRTGFVD